MIEPFRSLQWPWAKRKLFDIGSAQCGCQREHLHLSHPLWPSAHRHQDFVNRAALQLLQRGRTWQVLGVRCTHFMDFMDSPHCAQGPAAGPVASGPHGISSSKCQPGSSVCCGSLTWLSNEVLLGDTHPVFLQQVTWALGTACLMMQYSERMCSQQSEVSAVNPNVVLNRSSSGDLQSSENLSFGATFRAQGEEAFFSPCAGVHDYVLWTHTQQFPPSNSRLACAMEWDVQ